MLASEPARDLQDAPQQIVLSKQNTEDPHAYQTAPGDSEHKKMNADLEDIVHDYPAATTHNCFSNRTFFQEEHNTGKQMNTRYSEVGRGQRHADGVNLGSEDECDVHFPHIKDPGSQHNSQRIIVHKNSPRKNVPIFGGAMTLYQQSNQEGAGVQRPAKHLTQLASAEGDCYRHEEDLNDREACLSDGGVENLQKSQQSYPFNNCNRNMEMAYQLQNLQPTQQPRFFKHSQSNRSLERGQG